jgi:hypothetical protein
MRRMIQPRSERRRKPKPKRQTEWCSGAGKKVSRERKLEERVNDEPDDYGYDGLGPMRVRNNAKVRCGTCGRRLVPKIHYDGYDGMPTSQRVPQHKAK